MIGISQVRGALLEEVVVFLLRNVGYEIVLVDPTADEDEIGLRDGGSGLELKGRGAWHQVDALVQHKYSSPFIFPVRLIVEAKCYRRNRPVGIDVVRNLVGLHKDISENFFSYSARGREIKGVRFNYCAAIFSSSGYTSGAIEYAIAHQVFLIQYDKIPTLVPTVDAILEFDEECLSNPDGVRVEQVRTAVRQLLQNGVVRNRDRDLFSEDGLELLESALGRSVRRIRGSYFGMLQGKWPIHILSRDELSGMQFREEPISCRVIGRQDGAWAFSPSDARRGEDGWFELFFSLPEEIAELVAESWDDPFAVANVKRRHFSYIDLSGMIDGVYRSIRLELDREWLNDYLRRMEGLF